ncbi:MAG: hypothetical protein QW409_02970 [Candidatus Aenigmatarchaeota archaeon]
MRDVEKLDYISFALVNGIVTAIVFLIIAILQVAALGSLVGMMRMGMFLVGGILSLVLSPIIGFVTGFIGGLIFAALYNFLVNRIVKIKAE